MRLIWLLATLVVLSSAGTVKDPPKVRYDNYAVYKLSIKNKIQLSLLNRLSERTQNLNIWKDYDEFSKQMDIMVSPSESKRFQLFLKLYGINNQLLISNVQVLIDGEQVSSRDSGTFGWKRYYNLDEIEAWLDEILQTHPGITEDFSVGQSYEGRRIRGIKISHGSNKPGIFIESNIHAREWITSASATWFINELLTSQQPEVRNLANSYDWYIVPVFNVDGFAYSHQSDRMWRKTRQPHPTSSCIGVDGNRNFDSQWMVNNGASDDPCSETFAGPVPWSEPETKALSDYLTSIRDKFSVYISFHSYGQWLLSPYGHTKEEFPENYNDLLEIGDAFSGAIKNLVYGTEYVHGSTATVLYVASGSSVDWVFNELDKKVGFTIEFRDKARFGFVLPPSQILANCEELMAGMIALIDRTNTLGYI
ncbi:zinc carboxypeptidase [Drosophila grimshawi]|uniref:Zinc carboxypeptidase A 1 n=1 Tax=Drosophila grimshawi TaxID=7222 RepID=B4JD30_DROGR|nr:zinc carboxypeptidase [Drosophila grimshawi]EDW04274.1 GH10072 [Drosophila grimshawi]